MNEFPMGPIPETPVFFIYNMILAMLGFILGKLLFEVFNYIKYKRGKKYDEDGLLTPIQIGISFGIYIIFFIITIYSLYTLIFQNKAF